LLLALYLPLKFKAPKSTIDHLPEYIALDELQTRWNKSRAAWNSFLKEMPENLLDKAVFKHPRAGRIGWGHTFKFFQVHFDRHLKQIARCTVDG
jgi:hypothetical protein